jgi:hypothetical protein
VSPVEQELPTFPEHPSSTPVFSGVRVTRSIVLLIIVCPFVLSLLAFVLSVLQYTNSDYTFGIFKLFLEEPPRPKLLSFLKENRARLQKQTRQKNIAIFIRRIVHCYRNMSCSNSF